MTDLIRIDFFEFSVLLENCIPPGTAVKTAFWHKAIDQHHYKFNREDRLNIYNWITSNSVFRQNVKTNINCQLFEARYNPDNQYKVITKDNSYDCFKWNGKYHISISTSILEKFILDVVKIEESDNE